MRYDFLDKPVPQAMLFLRTLLFYRQRGGRPLPSNEKGDRFSFSCPFIIARQNSWRLLNGNLAAWPALAAIRYRQVNEMKNIARAFIHGLDSSSRGTKGSYFRERYPGMFIEDYPALSASRMEQLERASPNGNPDPRRGSSYGALHGGYLCVRGNETRVRRLILLAPALGHANFTTCSLQRRRRFPSPYHGSDNCRAARGDPPDRRRASLWKPGPSPRGGRPQSPPTSPDADPGTPCWRSGERI